MHQQYKSNLFHHETFDGQNKVRVHNHQSKDGNTKHCEQHIKFSITMKHWMVKTSLESTDTSLQMVRTIIVTNPTNSLSP